MNSVAFIAIGSGFFFLLQPVMALSGLTFQPGPVVPYGEFPLRRQFGVRARFGSVSIFQSQCVKASITVSCIAAYTPQIHELVADTNGSPIANHIPNTRGIVSAKHLPYT